MGSETLPSACYIYPDQEYIYFMGSETLPSACYILSDNIYTLWGRKRFLLPVTYFPTNLVYLFTLRVTSITIEAWEWASHFAETNMCLVPTF